ncbi:sigma 54-interacting transcriptional regulator [Clostridiaceae bacterium M8S5]|nr:sigma 54-interacting transcriptional regulator [Clostridiaceae bacterium M8S5]
MLKDSSCRYILQHIKEALIQINTEGKIVIANKEFNKLLNIDKDNVIGKNILSVLPNSNLPMIIKKKKPLFKQELCIDNRRYLVDSVPIFDSNNNISGAFSLFNDITEIYELNKEIANLEMLQTVMNAFDERVVVVDEKGNITMMSKAYKKFLNIDKPEGKHISDVIENTRLHIVLMTGEKEVGEVQQVKGHKMISMRIPLKKGNEIIGAVGKVMFKDLADLLFLNKKISNLQKELEYYKNKLNKNQKAKYSFEQICENSESMKYVINLAKRVANTDSSVLILGESGTGKELFAHAIHNASNRRYGPFIKINCGAIPAELLESELFGYEEGAFTGAKKGGKMGRFELADGGTILLDEIGDMPLNMQVKLLRVLQEKQIVKLGSNDEKEIDVRVIAATNKDLEKEMNNKAFREDLFYRLNVMSIKLPALRERKEDIEMLANKLTIKIAQRLGIYVEGISKEAINYLKDYSWPGNVRELENIIERAINLLGVDLIIKPTHLPERITKKKFNLSTIKDKNLKKIIAEVEKEVIKEILAKTEGNKNKASKLLGISRVSLYKKIDEYGLN